MNEIPQNMPPIGKTTSSVLKLFLIGFNIPMLMMPAVWISSLTSERHERRDSVIKEIASKRGGSQIVSGPFLSVPYYSLLSNRI